MKCRRGAAIFLAVTFILSLFYVGCSQNGSKIGGGIDQNQYLNVVLGAEPKTLDPSKGTDLYSSQVLTEVMEGLTRIEQDVEGRDVVKPAGAESWKISEDGLTWTFKLRNFNWSDGQKVKASDYEYGIKRTLNPKTESSYAFLLSPIKGASLFNSKRTGEEQVGVKAIDDNTLEIKLDKPCPYFLQTTYFRVMYPQRRDVVEKLGDKYGLDKGGMIYCGPFIIKEWIPESKIELVKNNKYWDEKSVKLTNVSLKIINEENSRMNELEKGTLDLAVVTKADWIKKLNGTGKFNVDKGYEPTTIFNFYNQRDKLFSSAKVRKAFSIAATREDMAKSLYSNLAVPAYGWCPPKIQIGTEEYREKANYEPVKKLIEDNKDAKSLLIEGLKDLNMDLDTSKVTVKFLQSGTDDRSKEVAEYMKKMYEKALGVKVEIEQVEWAIFEKKIDNMDYKIAGMGWSGDYNDPNSEFDIFMSYAGMIPTGWRNKSYDDLLIKSQSTSDINSRINMFKECEKILLYDDAVVSPLVYRVRNTYIQKYVKNIYNPLFGAGAELKYAYTEGRK